MAELIDEIQVEDSPVLTKKEAEEKRVRDYIDKDTGLLNIGVTPEKKPEPETEKKVISADKKTEVIAPKLITQPLNVGEREGIVTPSERIVRKPIGEGIVGLKETKEKAPFANLTDRVPVGVDRFGKDVYGTLEEEGKKDQERQKKPMSYDEFKEKVMSGEITRATKYGSPETLKFITSVLKNENVAPREKEKRDRMLQFFYKNSQYADPSKKTLIPFVEEGKFKSQEGDNPRLNNSKKRFAENKLEFYETIKNQFGNFKNVNDQRLIEQKLLNRISTGNSAKSVLRVAIERLNEIPRAVPTILPFSKYVYDYGRLGLNPDLWEATREEREETVQKFKDTLQDELNIPLLMDVMNEAIEQELKIDLDEGNISKEKFEQLTQVKVGDTIFKRQFVNEDLAMKILDTSFKQLNDSQKIGVYLTEVGMPMGGAMPLGRFIAANQAKKQTAKLRETVNKKFTPKEAQAYSKFTDIELVESLKNLELSKMQDVKSLVKSINMKALEDSIKLDIVAKNSKKLLQRSYLAGVKYRSLLADPNATQAELTSALVQYRRLYAQTVRDAITMRSTPILKEGVQEIFPLVTAQYLGQEFLTPENMDSFTGELLGVAYYLMFRGSMSMLTGRVAKSLDGWGGGVVNSAAKTVENIMETFYVVTGGKVENAMPKGWLANRTKEDYERLLGKKLDAKELKSLEWTQNLVKYMGEENATIVMQNLKRDYELRVRLANLFPEVVPKGQTGMNRAEIMQLLSGDVGQTSKVQWLMTARAFMEKNLGAFDPGDIKGIKQATEYQKSLELSTTAQTTVLNRILESAKEQGIDFKNNDVVNRYVTGLQDRIRYTKAFNQKMAIDLKEKLDGYISRIEKDPSISSKAGLVQELKDSKLDIAGIADGENLTEFDVVAQLSDDLKDSYTNLKSSTDIVKSNRENIVKHGKQFSNTAEKYINTHIANKLFKARVPYQKLDQEMKDTNNFIDLSKLVRSLVDDSVEFKDKPLSLFFSKEKAGNQFFSSPLNKALYKSFKMMAQRTLKNMPDELVNKLETLATIKPTANTPNPFYIADNIEDFDEFDLVLKIADNQDNLDLGLQNFRPFLATAYEVNNVRSAFRNYAYRIKDKDPQLSRSYMERKDELDTLFREKMPEKAQEYDDAATQYKAIVFDEEDIPNSINKIQNSVKRTDENPEGLSFIYKKGGEPDTLFDELGDISLKFIKDGDAAFLGQLGKQFKHEARGFQDKTLNVEGVKNFVPVFDLTTPYGVEKLETFKSLLKEKLYMKVGREYFTSDTATLAGQRKANIAKRAGGYLFVDGLDDKLKQLDEVFEVDIIDVNGNRDTMSLNPFTDLIEESKDITNFIAKNVNAQEDLKDYITTLKNNVANTRERVLSNMKLLEDDLNKINNTLGENTFEATPSGYLRFFEKHVIGGSLERLQKNKLAIQNTTNLPKERVDEIFEFMIGNGLLEYGNRQPMKGRAFQGFDGETYVYETFENPERILQAMLDNPNSAAIINSILTPSHRDNILDLMDLVNGRQGIAKTDDLLTVKNTAMRKITHNELASRGYNIARGMVSPLYVTTEFGLRIASQAGVNIMNLAVSNEKAAELLLLVIENPENMTKADISLFNELLKTFLTEQITRQGYTVPDFTEEGLQNFREKLVEEKKSTDEKELEIKEGED